jgi:hypothetical protein
MHTSIKYNYVQHFIYLHVYMTIGTHPSKSSQNLEGVKIGKTFAKWGNLNKNLLNEVISIKMKIEGKN